ncbi:MAG: serine hydrolase domain-containing protein [Bacteroidota bacterium]
MNRLLILILSVFLLQACNLGGDREFAPALQPGFPGAAGMSAERLSRIDTLLQQAVDQGKIPGAVALVARNGKIVYYRAFGMADNSTGREMTRDAIFRIASQTKAITSTAVMMLWEEGRFGLDDPISRYIPEFKDPVVLDTFNESDSSYTTVPATREITIRQLLSHTSGLGYGAIDGDARFRKIYAKAGIIDAFTTEPIQLGENIKKLAKLPLHFNPGEGYYYSEGLDVLGYLVELVSGMPFDRFLKERIFDPIGMEDTWFYLPDDRAGRLVSVQYKQEGNWVRYPVDFYDPDYPVKGARSYFAGGAGLSGTAVDYAMFLQMYLNNGAYNNTRLLSRTTIKTMMSNQIGDFWGPDPDSYYGLAFSVVTPKGVQKGGMGSTGTFSWGGYFNTQYFADPEEQLIGILMKQTQGPVNDDTYGKFKVLVEAAVDD